MEEQPLHDRVTLVTGAGRGIGAAIALRFAQEGSDVFLVSRNENELVQVSKKITGETGRKSGYCVADVGDENEVKTAVNKCIESMGGIDVVVNAAGISMSGKSEQFPLENWEKVINTNLTGTFLFCREVGNYFISIGKKGKIINITSVVAHAAIPQRAAYSSSKGGVKQLTENLALEWGPFGIRVNSITPGFIDTAQFRQFVERGIHDPVKIISRIPLRKMGTPEDITGPALFLASDLSEYVTGVTLIVDGGVLINGYV